MQRLQEWIRLPSIAAQDIGYPEGPQTAFLSALHAIHSAGRVMPVNLVLVAEAASGSDEAKLKQQLCTRLWIDDLPFVEALERLESRPTVNIEGLVAGYTGPGGKTVLPHRAESSVMCMAGIMT